MVRNSNEDSYAASAKNNLFLVADGMGGHAAGEIASHIAASTVEEIIGTKGSRRSSAQPYRRQTRGFTRPRNRSPNWRAWAAP
jgi:serine/threonine protein phosphatase PrpC